MYTHTCINPSHVETVTPVAPSEVLMSLIIPCKKRSPSLVMFCRLGLEAIPQGACGGSRRPLAGGNPRGSIVEAGRIPVHTSRNVHTEYIQELDVPCLVHAAQACALLVSSVDGTG